MVLNSSIQEFIDSRNNTILKETISNSEIIKESLGSWFLDHLLLNFSLIFNILMFILIFLNKVKTPIFDMTRYRGVIWNLDGTQHGSFKIDPTKKLQEYRGRKYHFNPNHSSYYLLTFLFWRSKHFQYWINNPDPIILNSGDIKPYLDSKAYDEVIEADHVAKISKEAKSGLLAMLLTPRNIIIGLVIIAIIYYIASGGKLGTS